MFRFLQGGFSREFGMWVYQSLVVIVIVIYGSYIIPKTWDVLNFNEQI